MRKQRGFTLIELMIVVFVIGILAAIAYPSYQGAMRDSRRAVAQADLMTLAGSLERQYTTNPDYSAASLPFNESPQEGATKYYDLTLATSASGARFTLSATPKGVQAGDTCGTLTLDSRNTKGPVGCW